MVRFCHSPVLHALGSASYAERHELRFRCVCWWRCDFGTVVFLVRQEALLWATGRRGDGATGVLFLIEGGVCLWCTYTASRMSVDVENCCT